MQGQHEDGALPEILSEVKHCDEPDSKKPLLGIERCRVPVAWHCGCQTHQHYLEFGERKQGEDLRRCSNFGMAARKLHRSLWVPWSTLTHLVKSPTPTSVW